MAKDQQDLVDVLIIGGGFSGLSAAATLARQLHTVVLFDSGIYRNARSSKLHVVPTWDGQDPDRFRAIARDELAKYGTVQVYQHTEITKVTKTGKNIFEAHNEACGRSWRGRKVILATGVHEKFPSIPGYDDCWARGIYHCLFCHGYEQRETASAGVLAVDWISSEHFAIHMGHMAAALVPQVTIYTNGNEDLAIKLNTALQGRQKYRVDGRVIKRLVPGTDLNAQVNIVFADDSSKSEAFLAHSPFTHVNGPFSEQLGLKLTPMGDYEIQPPFNATNVEGIFAAGDVTTLFKVAPNAIASGSMTGAGVSARLQEEQLGIRGVF